MVHQVATKEPDHYTRALLKPELKPPVAPRLSQKWSAAANHLLQQSGLKGKINPNWVPLVP
eukprot:6115891-Ditylum_brightwellii.AAC.1